MPTIQSGSTLERYFDDDTTITITPASGGSVRFGCSAPVGATRPADRVIYSATSIAIPGGSTVFAQAVGGDATWMHAESSGVYSSLSALAASQGSFIGALAMVGPDSSGQYAEWYWNGVRWRPRSGIIAMKNTAGSVTDAGTSEQDVYSIVIPAGLIGPTDDWYVDHFWQWPNSATTKTVRVKFGGTTIASLAATTTASGRGTTHIYMRDSKTAQVFANATAAIAWQEGQTSGSAPSTATVDTNSDITVNLTGQWGTAGAGSNLITLERVAVGIKFAY